MKKAVVVIALLSQALGLTYADDQTGTRGIGQYPGHPSQFTAPQMVKDDTYRNIAHRVVLYDSQKVALDADHFAAIILP